MEMKITKTITVEFDDSLGYHVVRQEDPWLLRLAKSRLRRLLACMGLRARSHGDELPLYNYHKLNGKQSAPTKRGVAFVI